MMFLDKRGLKYRYNLTPKGYPKLNKCKGVYFHYPTEKADSIIVDKCSHVISKKRTQLLKDVTDV